VDDQHTEPVEATPVCYRHPDRPTGLSCTECGKPICPDCSHDAAVGQKCAECARPIGRNRVITARNLRTSTPVVTVILALTITSFIAQGAVHDYEARFFQVNFLVAAGEWWRLLTSAFLHGGLLHIGFNMYALWLFGPPLERRFGSAPFAALYLAAAVAGGAAYALFGPPNVAVLGASGAIFGLFGAVIAATYRNRNTPAGADQFRRLLGLLAINLLLPFMLPAIAWQAHMGGLAIGLVIGGVWTKLDERQSNITQRTIVATALFLLAFVVGVLA